MSTDFLISLCEANSLPLSRVTVYFYATFHFLKGESILGHGASVLRAQKKYKKNVFFLYMRL